MSMRNIVIRAEGLIKSFKGTQALKGVDLTVPEGSVFGLLGPNGSGKTTLIRLVLGLLRPGRGSSTVFGQDSLAMDWQTRQRIGYLSEEPFPYEDLGIDDLLRFVSAFFEQWDWDRSRDLIERMNVPRDRELRDMSVGQRRRAELLLVLAQDPDLLVLDDPTAGLDASIRREFLRGALEVAREEGKTVLFTSHVLTDVERIVDTIGFLIEGRIHLVSPLDELKARTKRIVIEADEPPAQVCGELARETVPGGVAIVTSDYSESLRDEIALAANHVLVEDLSLEDIFLAVTASAARAS